MYDENIQKILLKNFFTFNNYRAIKNSSSQVPSGG